MAGSCGCDAVAMAERMTKQECLDFIAAAPARTGKLATVREDGRPHVAPIWVDLDGDVIVFNTSVDSLKGRAIVRDPRVSLCFDDERPPFAFVVVEGECVVGHDPIEKLRWATSIAGRYMGADRAEAYGRRNAVPEEYLVRLQPTRIFGLRNISD
jgi:PPOX class probable F420-dependent enzyme